VCRKVPEYRFDTLKMIQRVCATTPTSYQSIKAHRMSSADTEEPVVDSKAEGKEKKPRTPKVTQQHVYTSKDFEQFSRPFQNWKTMPNGNKPYEIETISHELEPPGAEATAEEWSSYRETSGSVEGFILKGKKECKQPQVALIRHRRRAKEGHFFPMTHAEATMLRNAKTYLKEGAPIDEKYDELYTRLTNGNTALFDTVANLNEGVKVASADGTMKSAPVETRFFPRMLIVRPKALDEPGENDIPIKEGEMFHVPPSIQLKWLNDPDIKRGENIDQLVKSGKITEDTMRIPIKYDAKEWSDLLKEGQAKVKKAAVDEDKKKEKVEKAAKRKADKIDKVEKSTDGKSDGKTDGKSSTASASGTTSASKRVKTDSIDVGANIVSQLVQQASRSGAKTAEVTISLRIG